MLITAVSQNLGMCCSLETLQAMMEVPFVHWEMPNFITVRGPGIQPAAGVVLFMDMHPLPILFPGKLFRSL